MNTEPGGRIMPDAYAAKELERFYGNGWVHLETGDMQDITNLTYRLSKENTDLILVKFVGKYKGYKFSFILTISDELLNEQEEIIEDVLPWIKDECLSWCKENFYRATEGIS